MSDCGCGAEQAAQLERKTLRALLAINALMFLVEIVLGLIADSTALIADSLDMLADASVYAVSLYVVGKSALSQSRAASITGVLQLVLGVGVFLEAIRRLFLGSSPDALFMVGTGCLALIANVGCVVLLAKHRDGKVHMRASWIFSTNDVIANLGVVVSGLMVWWLGSRIPDLVIACIICTVVVKGALKILQEAREAHPDASL